MSTALFFLIPIGMLAVVWSLCFVGACFPVSGIRNPYSDNVLDDSNIVAYWPLNDLLTPLNKQGQTAPTDDLSGNNHGGSYTIPFPLTNDPLSKPFPNPALSRLTSIVPGDAGSTKNPLAASTDFEGGFVGIPWNTPNSTPANLTDFTFEAWVKRTWMEPAPGFIHVVFSAFINNTGFVIFVDENNNWKFTIGNGTGFTQPPSSVTLDPNSMTYVAVTFSSADKMLNLWINPSSDTSAAPTPVQSFPNTNYTAVDMNQQVTFFIGAGANDQTPRMQMNGPGAPTLPFQGQIQDVALYKVALDGNELQSHFQSGVTT